MSKSGTPKALAGRNNDINSIINILWYTCADWKAQSVTNSIIAVWEFLLVSIGRRKT
jgi:hypothetical protein